LLGRLFFDRLFCIVATSIKQLKLFLTTFVIILKINIIALIGVALLIATIILLLMLCVRISGKNRRLGLRLKSISSENERLRQLSLAGAETAVMLIFDTNAELKYVNEHFKQLYHMDEQAYINNVGKNLSDYLKWSGYNDIFNISGRKTFVGRAENSKGRSIWKQITITPNTDERGNVNYIVVEVDITSVKEAEYELQLQKKRSDELLLNMLPAEIVEELKTKGSAVPRVYKSASVLFADIKNFTKWAESLSPRELIDTLQQLFSEFDDVLAANYIEKIKTIGDAYMCAGGLPMKNNSHPFNIVLAAFGLQQAITRLDERRANEGGEPWLMRIGIHTGAVVTGVVGKTRTVYDMWGDTVNIANRLEAACTPGRVNISEATYSIIKDYFECEYRGKIQAKHKGEIDMYFVNRLNPEYSADESGFVPNDRFRDMLSSL